MLSYSTHARRRMQERTITKEEVTSALHHQSAAPVPGDNGHIVRFGYSGARILKIVLSEDEQTIVSVMWAGSE
jgi:Domain of unknown function (DUF4258)